MKYYFFFFFGFVNLLGFFEKGHGAKSHEYFKKSESVFSKVVGGAGRKLAEKHQMSVIGIGGSENHEGISLISLTFERNKGPLPKEEGRKIIVEIVNELVKIINSNEKIRPFLKNYPFEINNFEILIINSTEDNDDLFDPDIEVFSCSRERVGYRTVDPEDTYKYKSEIFESYAEALEQVRKGN